MPLEKKIKIVYMYLKQGKWKQKSVIVDEDKVLEYEQKYRVLIKEEVWC